MAQLKAVCPARFSGRTFSAGEAFGVPDAQKARYLAHYTMVCDRAVFPFVDNAPPAKPAAKPAAPKEQPAPVPSAA